MKTNWQDCVSSCAQTSFTIFSNMFSKLHDLFFPIEQYRMNYKNRHTWGTTAIKNPLIKKYYLKLVGLILVFKILKTLKLVKNSSHLSFAMLKKSITRENLS